MNECSFSYSAIESVKTFDNQVIDLYFKSHLSEAKHKKQIIYFILDDFIGESYFYLHKYLPPKAQIIGVPIFLKFSKLGQVPPCYKHPIFSDIMRGVTICFSRYFDTLRLLNLVFLAQAMGAQVKKKFVCSRITHLVSSGVGGEKYRKATNFATPIMSEEWLIKCWLKRFSSCEESSALISKGANKFPLKPFVGCFISFIGFQQHDKKCMESLALEQAAKIIDCENVLCTHLVVNDENVLPENIKLIDTMSLFVVRVEWFWASVQLDFCADENLYSFLFSSKKEDRSLTCKRSTLNDRNKSYSLLDSSGELSLSESVENSKAPKIITFNHAMSPRHMRAYELLQTENNYVNCLHIIINVYSKGLEDYICSKKDPSIDNTDIKLLFGNVLPIYEVHNSLLDKLNNCLKNWTDCKTIGSIFNEHMYDFLKAYPPFINFYNDSTFTLKKLVNNPKFHAFLMMCQSKPECGRQSLEDLLIRPVQRLPSLILLLCDLLNHTSQSHSDWALLNTAIPNLKDVLNKLNESKRTTETQVRMFEIVKEIENCPPNLLSSQRTFISKARVTGLCQDPYQGRNFYLFLFNDCLEICKRRQMSKSSILTVSSTNIRSSTSTKYLYKHIELIHLSHIKILGDIVDTKELRNAFAIICSDNIKLDDQLLIFSLEDEQISKIALLESISKNVVNTLCVSDKRSILLPLHPNNIKINSANGGNLNQIFNKAFKTAKNAFRSSVNRAFSIKYSSPYHLKRASSSNFTHLNSTFNKDAVSGHSLSSLDENGEAPASSFHEKSIQRDHRHSTSAARKNRPSLFSLVTSWK